MDSTVPECPLCMEELDLDDKSFFPCTCAYQICRFCWHRIRSESSPDSSPATCPACRKPYTDCPANFKPTIQPGNSTGGNSSGNKSGRSGSSNTGNTGLGKNKKSSSVGSTSTNKRQLQDLRVVQKNLIFVVGLSPRIAEVDVLKRYEYFGKFGKIMKIVVNGAREPCTTASAYITYNRESDALRALTSVNNTLFDNRTIKANLGTTKYCSHFLRSQNCPKSECMYLHSVGESEASFTKDDMLNGKHSEYEKGLLDAFLATNCNNEQQQQHEKSNRKDSTTSTTTTTGNGSSSSTSSSSTTVCTTPRTTSTKPTILPVVLPELNSLEFEQANEKTEEELTTTTDYSNETEVPASEDRTRRLESSHNNEQLTTEYEPSAVVLVESNTENVDYTTNNYHHELLLTNEELNESNNLLLQEVRNNGYSTTTATQQQNTFPQQQQQQQTLLPPPGFHYTNQQQQQHNFGLQQQHEVTLQQQQHQHQPHQQQNNLQNNSSTLLYDNLLEWEPDYNFDPFSETQKAFEELIQQEVEEGERWRIARGPSLLGPITSSLHTQLGAFSLSNHNTRNDYTGQLHTGNTSSNILHSNQQQQQHHQHHQIIQPPPGFNISNPSSTTLSSDNNSWMSLDPAIIFSSVGTGSAGAGAAGRQNQQTSLFPTYFQQQQNNHTTTLQQHQPPPGFNNSSFLLGGLGQQSQHSTNTTAGLGQQLGGHLSNTGHQLLPGQHQLGQHYQP